MIPARVRAWAQAQLDAPITSMDPVGGGLTDTIYAVRCDGRPPVMLRHVGIHQWGETGRQHVLSEARGCALMADAGLPTPRLVASDPTGEQSGAYANLTTWLPGRVRLDELGAPAIDALARAAVLIHQQPVPDGLRPRPYAFWVPTELAPPGWARWPALWEQAIAVFAGGPPDTPAGLVHRDFHPGNILWQGDEITGVIDWAETSWGPPDLDVVHAATNFAILHDPASADAFAAAYRRHGGVVDPDPDAARFWTVSDILGFLPDPMLQVPALVAPRPELTPSVIRVRLEDLLRRTLG